MAHTTGISRSMENAPTATGKLHVYFTIDVRRFSISDRPHPSHPTDNCLLSIAIAASYDYSFPATPFTRTA
jgi:hypothetical protein